MKNKNIIFTPKSSLFLTGRLINFIVSALFLLNAFNSYAQNDLLKHEVTGIYRYFWQEMDGYDIWIVDGQKVRQEIFNEFVYGGNPQRYTFVPENEIWIDNAISCEEFTLTLDHELNECHLMKTFGMSYYDAHDSSLARELQMRRKMNEQNLLHEAELKPVSPIDYDSTKEIHDIADKIKLKNVYRQYYTIREGISIWIVDGAVVRRDIYPDFGFSGNDMAYHFIPFKEIWIDSQVSCEELEYSITLELAEREFMKKGIEYDSAYTEALKSSDDLRKKNEELISKHQPVKVVQPLYRDIGIKK